jgi:diaminopimelate epimerase
MSDIDIQKYTGAGNDFLMLNNLDNSLTDYQIITKSLISLDGNTNLDGVIFVEKSQSADFKMNYYNKDGTGNALCGNGLRATIRYLCDNNFSVKNTISLEAVNKIFTCRLQNDGLISVNFPPPDKIKFKFKLKVHFIEWWEMLSVSYLDVGSPHIIVFIEDIEKPKIKSIDEVNIIEWGRNIRMHKDLMPEGANVNFIEVVSSDEGILKIRSYERGVEGETLACGTGALSAAIAAHVIKNVKKPVKLLTKSGEYLTVNFNISDNLIKDLYLTGTAKRI